MGAVPQEHVVGLQVAVDDRHPDDVATRKLLDGVPPGTHRPDYVTDPAGWRQWADANVACAMSSQHRRCYIPRHQHLDVCMEHANEAANDLLKRVG